MRVRAPGRRLDVRDLVRLRRQPAARACLPPRLAAPQSWRDDASSGAGAPLPLPAGEGRGEGTGAATRHPRPRHPPKYALWYSSGRRGRAASRRARASPRLILISFVSGNPSPTPRRDTENLRALSLMPMPCRVPRRASPALARSGGVRCQLAATSRRGRTRARRDAGSPRHPEAYSIMYVGGGRGLPAPVRLDVRSAPAK